jgi:hypothetical protein
VREDIVETCYTAHLWRGVSASGGLQYIAHPGYDRDRGAVLVEMLRLHVDSESTVVPCIFQRTLAEVIGAQGAGHPTVSIPHARVHLSSNAQTRVSDVPHAGRVGERIASGHLAIAR